MAVSTIVGMAGCLSRIVEHQPPNGGERCYIVRIAPVSHTSPLSLKTFYTKRLADEYMGDFPSDSSFSSDEKRKMAISFLCGKADSVSALDALTSAFEFDGGCSVLYADPVVLVELLLPRPLDATLNEHV